MVRDWMDRDKTNSNTRVGSAVESHNTRLSDWMTGDWLIARGRSSLLEGLSKLDDSTA